MNVPDICSYDPTLDSRGKPRRLHKCLKCGELVVTTVPHPLPGVKLKFGSFLGRKCVILKASHPPEIRSHTLPDQGPKNQLQAEVMQVVDDVFEGFNQAMFQTRRVPIDCIDKDVDMDNKPSELGGMDTDDRIDKMFPKDEL